MMYSVFRKHAHSRLSYPVEIFWHDRLFRVRSVICLYPWHVIYASLFTGMTCILARGFHGTFGENNRQVIVRDSALTHSVRSLSLSSPLLTLCHYIFLSHSIFLSSSLFSHPFSHSFQPSDTRPERRETPHLVFSPQFFRHICFCLATTMHRLYRYDIKICAAMYLLLSFFHHLPSLLLRRFLLSYCSSPYFPFADTSHRKDAQKYSLFKNSVFFYLRGIRDLNLVDGTRSRN